MTFAFIFYFHFSSFMNRFRARLQSQGITELNERGAVILGKGNPLVTVVVIGISDEQHSLGVKLQCAVIPGSTLLSSFSKSPPGKEARCWVR